MSMIAFGYLRRITPHLRLISLPRLFLPTPLGALAVAPWGVSSFAVAKVSIKNETTAMYILFFMQNVQKSGAKAAETVSES